jgi:hypothetical protein
MLWYKNIALGLSVQEVSPSKLSPQTAISSEIFYGFRQSFASA